MVLTPKAILLWVRLRTNRCHQYLDQPLLHVDWLFQSKPNCKAIFPVQKTHCQGDQLVVALDFVVELYFPVIPILILIYIILVPQNQFNALTVLYNNIHFYPVNQKAKAFPKLKEVLQHTQHNTQHTQHTQLLRPTMFWKRTMVTPTVWLLTFIH